MRAQLRFAAVFSGIMAAGAHKKRLGKLINHYLLMLYT